MFAIDRQGKIVWKRREDPPVAFPISNIEGAPHQASTLDFLDRHGLEIVDPYPPTLPELNPIEKVWSWMGGEVAKHRVSTKAGLIRVIKDTWAKLPQETIQRYIKHLSTVCNKIIKSAGDNIME